MNSSWSWERIEARLKRNILRDERKLKRLETYHLGAMGDTLGQGVTTPCVVEPDPTLRRKKRKKAAGKKPFKGAVICHRCDHRECISAEHLFWGTQGDNMRDMYLKGRRGEVPDIAARIVQLKAKLFLWRIQLETKSLVTGDS